MSLVTLVRDEARAGAQPERLRNFSGFSAGFFTGAHGTSSEVSWKFRDFKKSDVEIARDFKKGNVGIAIIIFTRILDKLRGR